MKIRNENGYTIREYDCGAIEKFITPEPYNSDENGVETSCVPEPTDYEIFQAQVLLTQMDIMAKQAEQDEVLSAILLNGLEG